MDAVDLTLEELVNFLQITSIHDGSSTSEVQANHNSTWRLSLYGKILVTDRVVRFKTLQNTLMWARFGVIFISSIPHGMFVLEFTSISGLNKVLDEGPWTFQNDFIMLQRVSPGIKPQDYKFDNISLWIQLHDIPSNLFSPPVITNLLHGLGTIYPINPLSTKIWKSFARVNVALNTDFCIKASAHSRIPSGDVIVAQLVYERLSKFCHICCKLGHEDMPCPSHLRILAPLPYCSSDSLKQNLIQYMLPKLTDSVKVSGLAHRYFNVSATDHFLAASSTSYFHSDKFGDTHYNMNLRKGLMKCIALRLPRCPASSDLFSTQSHTSILIPSDIYSCNLKISNLARNRDFTAACQLFDQMPHRDVTTYSTMIALHIKNHDLPKAEALFRKLPERNVVAESALIDGYAKAGRIRDARRVFDGMPVRNVVSWTSLISGYFRAGLIHEARRLFDEMPSKNVVTWTTMVLGYARNGLISDARRIFNRMPEKNVVSWTAMVKCYLENKQIDDAKELFDKMPYRNVYSWNIMISGCLDSGQVNTAIELFRVMPQKNVVSWTAMVTGLAKNGYIENAREFFNQMPEKDIAACNAMIVGYVGEGLTVEARKIFNTMPERDIVSWNAMVDGYIKNEHQEEALRLFLLMRCLPEKINENTLTIVTSICDSTTEIMEIQALAMRLGFQSDTCLTNALVTMYSRFGDLAASCRTFEELVTKDAISWTSMILAYSNHGCGNYALQVFSRMLRHGVKPDGITFVGLLTACSHGGLVEKGKMIFKSMRRAYGLEPKAEHYSCLVDLLGRAGLVKEAMMVVAQMPPWERDEAVLGTLLGACRVHGEIDVARNVGEELIELDPTGAGGYVLLANAYASRGKWDDAARVRKTMKERKVKKVPGYSQIEIKMRNHVFCVSDRAHPQINEIYAMLQDALIPQMEDMGYSQDVQYMFEQME